MAPEYYLFQNSFSLSSVLSFYLPGGAIGETELKSGPFLDFPLFLSRLGTSTSTSTTTSTTSLLLLLSEPNSIYLSD